MCISLGLDAEIFAVKRGSKEVIPAIDILDNPIETKSGLVTIDGTALEINPFPEFEIFGGMFFIYSLWKKVQDLKKEVENICWNNDRNYSVIVPCVGESYYCKTDYSILKNIKEFSPIYKPSYNAYDGTMERSKQKEAFINIGKQTTLRSGGCHIHIGNKNLDAKNQMQKDVVPIVKFLDYYVGLYFVLMTRNDKLEFVRRDFYGRAGSYRLPEHGIEYRVCSNALITSEKLFRETLDRIYDVLLLYFKIGRTQFAIEAGLLEYTITKELLNNAINFNQQEAFILFLKLEDHINDILKKNKINNHR